MDHIIQDRTGGSLVTRQPKSALKPDALTLNVSACLAALRPLARTGAHLAPLNGGYWGLYCRKQADEPSGGKLPVPLVMELEAAGLIVLGPDGLGRVSKTRRA